jgi:DNA-binding response OmpR family regulator
MAAKGVRHPPVIFYTSQDKVMCRAYAMSLGAFGLIGEPAQLLELVTRAVP